MHWAAKKNNLEITKFLIEKGAQIDKLDYLGKTPLAHAAKLNYLRPVKALLGGGAKPGIKDNQGNSSIDLCTDLKIQGFLKKGFLLQICLPLVAKNKRDEIWRSEGLTYFNNNNDDLRITEFPI